MAGLVFFVVILIFSAGLGFEAGRETGWRQHFKGEVVCAEALDQIVCKEKTK